MAFIAPLAAGAASFLGSTTGIAALTAAGSALTGFTAIQQGNYQAAVARNNAEIAEQNAVEESRKSQLESRRSDIEYAAALAGQMAEQGASGLDILGRSQLQSRNVTRRTGRQASLDIREAGTANARRLMQDAANFRAEGRAAKRQGMVTAIGAGLEGLRGISSDLGFTRSLAGSRSRGGRRPWDSRPDWYGRG